MDFYRNALETEQTARGLLEENLNFPNTFTRAQLNIIFQCVLKAASEICGKSLRDVILYGSYARGDFQDWSDIDIMILAAVSDAECRQFNRQINELLIELIHYTNLLLSINVIPHSRFEHMKDVYPFYNNIANEGVRL